MIEAQGLTKVFKDKKRGIVVAAQDLNFSCKPGQIFGLLGSNGAGKTTTLRMLAIILKPTKGIAIINGFDVVKHPETVRQQIGFLSCDTGLYPRLTAREMIRYFGRLYGMDEILIDQRITEISRMFNMVEFLDTQNDKLSTGMKQKVSIARAIIHNPPVMIFDEPAAGLDIISARIVYDFVTTCRRQGKTIIFSSHLLSEAEKLFDIIAVIHKGVILSIGTLDELKSQTSKDNLEDIFVKLVQEKDETEKY
ncbi:MAG: ATP-binding cassette domain-containing protein [Planctomycetota bacterium]|nr:ATP-binding cassette domain-containing protein [Planctomycetota bacterium]MDI6788862.1 ATP-binding cassette domain-containing protein [Planctomycetota bacterium]